MAGQHTKENINFNGFSGYYASMEQGYGGFNWSQMFYMNATYWEDVKTDWCDTGYQNVIKGKGEAFAYYANGLYASFQSADLNETFNLKSMIAASAWETNQSFEFRSYVYNNGIHLKGSGTVYLSQTAQKIDFSKIGNPGDFNNIVSITIVPGAGSYGNTCSYGQYGYTKGYVLALDNMKVTWNGKIPTGKGGMIGPGTQHHGHPANIPAAHLVTGGAHAAEDSDAQHPGLGHSAMESGSRSELASSGQHDHGSLTGDFRLPALEHFGP